VYALDITADEGLAPASEAAAARHVMWEIGRGSLNHASQAAYANLGYSYSRAILGRVGGVDAVIVGNGYLGADGRAYLYLIEAHTGRPLRQPLATDGLNGNGLSSPTAVDADGDGNVDLVFAGDLRGRLWRFDLQAGTARVLLATGQAITTAPVVTPHPMGGFMVNFATGSLLRPSDARDASTVYAAYGLWDSAPDANQQMLRQTLTTRCYGPAGGPCQQLVRALLAPQRPDWRSGHTRAWVVPLLPGERVSGEGSFVEQGRFYFTTYNPTVWSTASGDAAKVWGSNFLMELDYLSGAVAEQQPFLDLNADGRLTPADRLPMRHGEAATEPATPPGQAIQGPEGLAVGKFLGVGQVSQPVLVQLQELNSTVFNHHSGAAGASGAKSTWDDAGQMTLHGADGTVATLAATGFAPADGEQAAGSDAGTGGNTAHSVSIRGATLGQGGGEARGIQARTGRISWREWLQP